MIRGPGDFLRYIENPKPNLCDKSKVDCRCSCGSIINLSLKQLKYKIRNKKSLRCRSCAIKALWEKPEFREKISQKKIWSNLQLRELISRKSRENWENEDYIQKQSRIHKDPVYLEETRIRSRRLWEDEDFRARQKRIRSQPAWIHKQSQSMKALWKDPEYQNRVAASLSRVFISGRRSSIEIITRKLIRDLGWAFEEQKVIGPYIFDFYIVDHDVFVECQGEYWHSIGNAPSRDAAKFTYLEKACPNSRLLYLHERDFMNPKFIADKLSRFVLGNLEPSATYDFSFSSLFISKLETRIKQKGDRSLAKGFLDSYHYAQFGRSAKVIYGIFLGDKLVAVCKFSTPVRKEVATSFGYAPSEILELDRFCIHPNYHKKNFASWILARSVSRVFNEFNKVNCLVSFADKTYGHLGTIYRAANWIEYASVPPDYYYINDGGWIVHKKTLYNHAVKNGMKESEYACLHGYKKVYGKGKIKFIFRRP